MPEKESVKKLYALGHAKWYDLSKKFWNKAEAEEEFTRFLQSNLTSKTRILDLGCGTGSNLEKIRALNLPFKNYVGVDFSPDMLRIARNKLKIQKNVEFQEKDITKLDMLGKFDIILCSWALEHIQEPASFVNNIVSNMKGQSKLFLVFYSRPKWYLNYTLFPFIRFLFKNSAKDISPEEIKKFKNVTMRKSFSAHMATVVEIST
jgi:2-polyprenyl-3-methyl-5-hydroxy-6-metoxy-1,4-benzoquinol methylase